MVAHTLDMMFMSNDYTMYEISLITKDVASTERKIFKIQGVKFVYYNIIIMLQIKRNASL